MKETLLCVDSEKTFLIDMQLHLSPAELSEKKIFTLIREYSKYATFAFSLSN